MSLAENRAVVGVGRQTVKGTPVVATSFPRWEDATEVQADLKTEEIREGDGTASVQRLIKNVQFWKGKIVHGKARAIDLGFFLKGVCGTSSDNIAANGTVGQAAPAGTAKSGTLTSAIAVGATSASYTLVSGPAPAVNDWLQFGNGPNAEVRQATAVTGTGPYTLTIAATTNAHSAGEVINLVNKYGTIAVAAAGVGTLTYTVVAGAAPLAGDKFTVDVNLAGSTTAETFNCASVSGIGPYTLTLDRNTSFAHAAAAPAVQVATRFAHSFVPQLVRDYHTIILQYLLSTPENIQVSDAMFHSATIEGVAGKVIHADYEFHGLVGTDSTTAMTASYDSSSQNLLYYGGTFNIDGVTTGAVAPYVKMAKLSYKHPLDDSMQTEAATLADFVSTVRTIDIEYDLLWQDFTQFKKAYLNAGTTDSAIVGTGSLDLTWLAGGNDANNSLEIKVPLLHYKAAQLPPPKLAGKALIQKVQALAVVNPEVTFVLADSQFGLF